MGVFLRFIREGWVWALRGQGGEAWTRPLLKGIQGRPAQLLTMGGGGKGGGGMRAGCRGWREMPQQLPGRLPAPTFYSGETNIKFPKLGTGALC